MLSLLPVLLIKQNDVTREPQHDVQELVHIVARSPRLEEMPQRQVYISRRRNILSSRRGQLVENSQMATASAFASSTDAAPASGPLGARWSRRVRRLRGGRMVNV